MDGNVIRGVTFSGALWLGGGRKEKKSAWHHLQDSVGSLAGQLRLPSAAAELKAVLKCIFHLNETQGCRVV